MAEESARGRPAQSPGNEARLEALLARYGRQVYAMAYRMTGNDADAKDLSQEAFIRVWRSLDRLEPGAALDAWLHRVVTNLFIDMLRRRPKARIQSLDEPLATDEGAMARERADPETDVERIVLDRTMDRRVQEALLALREDLRMAIVLADVEGYAYEEIAEMMGVPIGTVKSRIHRARRALRDRLAPLRKESPGAP